MFDEFHKIIAELQKLPEPMRETARTAFITWCIARCIYYIVSAIVIWALGRRLIQACLAAWREARKSND
ncbi:MAG: hypothetical protein JWM57_194 [Phycisphaerales bacterium]|nr:hypothetical protein [Phycisphaerales bacterium]